MQAVLTSLENGLLLQGASSTCLSMISWSWSILRTNCRCEFLCPCFFERAFSMRLVIGHAILSAAKCHLWGCYPHIACGSDRQFCLCVQMTGLCASTRLIELWTAALGVVPSIYQFLCQSTFKPASINSCVSPASSQPVSVLVSIQLQANQYQFLCQSSFKPASISSCVNPASNQPVSVLVSIQLQTNQYQFLCQSTFKPASISSCVNPPSSQRVSVLVSIQLQASQPPLSCHRAQLSVWGMRGRECQLEAKTWRSPPPLLPHPPSTKLIYHLRWITRSTAYMACVCWVVTTCVMTTEWGKEPAWFFLYTFVWPSVFHSSVIAMRRVLKWWWFKRE